MTQRRIFEGRTTQCPSCGEKVRYSWLTGMSGPHLHFYANESNDVLLRSAWFPKIKNLLDEGALDPVVQSEIDLLLATLPPAMTQKYSVWSNVKCPRCKSEFPYRFKGSLKLRLEDSTVILIEGCMLDLDENIFVVEVDA